METIKLRDEFIKLGQALKAAGFVESGVDAKYAVQDGLVKVNGQTETQRGKKLHAGDVVEYDGQTVKITMGTMPKGRPIFSKRYIYAERRNPIREVKTGK